MQKGNNCKKSSNRVNFCNGLRILKIFVLCVHLPSHFLIAVFHTTSVPSANYFSATCDPYMNSVSCGMSNSQMSNNEPFRSSYPSGTSACNCYDYFGAYCTARCTTAYNSSSILISSNYGTSFNVNCPPGYYAVGCSLNPPQYINVDNYRYTIPLSGGTGCYCKDNIGTNCYASCVQNVSNYEIKSVYGGGGYFSLSCTNPKSNALGCTLSPVQSYGPGNFRAANPITDTTCECYTTHVGYCYAICGVV